MTHPGSPDGGAGEYANQDEALITDLAWSVSPIRFSDDSEHLEMVLRTNWKSPPAKRARVPRGGLLVKFCTLAEPATPELQRRRVLSFAQRYGLLGLCKTHRHPVASCFQRAHAPECDLWRWEKDRGGSLGLTEAIEDWILWSRRFRGTWAIASPIQRYRPLNVADVENAFVRMNHPRCQLMLDILREPPPSGVTERQPDGTYRPVHRESWQRQSHEVEVDVLQEWLNYLLTIAAVNRRVVPGKGNQLLAIADAYHARCPLFGALVIELVGECTGVSSQRLCVNPSCQRGFRPSHRNQKYCARCRAKDVSQQLATQRLRDKRYKQGLSARGRTKRAQASIEAE